MMLAGGRSVSSQSRRREMVGAVATISAEPIESRDSDANHLDHRVPAVKQVLRWTGSNGDAVLMGHGGQTVWVNDDARSIDTTATVELLSLKSLGCSDRAEAAKAYLDISIESDMANGGMFPQSCIVSVASSPLSCSTASLTADDDAAELHLRDIVIKEWKLNVDHQKQHRGAISTQILVKTLLNIVSVLHDGGVSAFDADHKSPLDQRLFITIRFVGCSDSSGVHRIRNLKVMYVIPTPGTSGSTPWSAKPVQHPWHQTMEDLVPNSESAMLANPTGTQATYAKYPHGNIRGGNMRGEAFANNRSTNGSFEDVEMEIRMELSPMPQSKAIRSGIRPPLGPVTTTSNAGGGKKTATIDASSASFTESDDPSACYTMHQQQQLSPSCHSSSLMSGHDEAEPVWGSYHNGSAGGDFDGDLGCAPAATAAMYATPPATHRSRNAVRLEPSGHRDADVSHVHHSGGDWDAPHVVDIFTSPCASSRQQHTHNRGADGTTYQEERTHSGSERLDPDEGQRDVLVLAVSPVVGCRPITQTEVANGTVPPPPRPAPVWEVLSATPPPEGEERYDDENNDPELCIEVPTHSDGGVRAQQRQKRDASPSPPVQSQSMTQRGASIEVECYALSPPAPQQPAVAVIAVDASPPPPPPAAPKPKDTLFALSVTAPSAVAVQQPADIAEEFHEALTSQPVGSAASQQPITGNGTMPLSLATQPHHTAVIPSLSAFTTLTTAAQIRSMQSAGFATSQTDPHPSIAPRTAPYPQAAFINSQGSFVHAPPSKSTFTSVAALRSATEDGLLPSRGPSRSSSRMSIECEDLDVAPSVGFPRRAAPVLLTTDKDMADARAMSISLERIPVYKAEDDIMAAVGTVLGVDTMRRVSRSSSIHSTSTSSDVGVQSVSSKPSSRSATPLGRAMQRVMPSTTVPTVQTAPPPPAAGPLTFVSSGFASVGAAGLKAPLTPKDETLQLEIQPLEDAAVPSFVTGGGEPKKEPKRFGLYDDDNEDVLANAKGASTSSLARYPSTSTATSTTSTVMAVDATKKIQEAQAAAALMPPPVAVPSQTRFMPRSVHSVVADISAPSTGVYPAHASHAPTAAGLNQSWTAPSAQTAMRPQAMTPTRLAAPPMSVFPLSVVNSSKAAPAPPSSNTAASSNSGNVNPGSSTLFLWVQKHHASRCGTARRIIEISPGPTPECVTLTMKKPDGTSWKGPAVPITSPAVFGNQIHLQAHPGLTEASAGASVVGTEPLNNSVVLDSGSRIEVLTGSAAFHSSSVHQTKVKDMTLCVVVLRKGRLIAAFEVDSQHDLRRFVASMSVVATSRDR